MNVEINNLNDTILKFKTKIQRASRGNRYLFLADPTSSGTVSSVDFLLMVLVDWDVGLICWPKMVNMKGRKCRTFGLSTENFTAGRSATGRACQNQRTLFKVVNMVPATFSTR